ncbi:MAG: M28 family peptidase, partial [Candidatus Krumholzibacteriia bacterium]
MRRWILCTLFAVLATTNFASELGEKAKSLTRAEMQSVIELLGHDLFEGRAPGTRGGDLAEICCRGLFQWMGLEPGWKGDYFQPFTMQAVTTEEMTVTAEGQSFDHPGELVGSSLSGTENHSLEGELVFAGFGIRSDIWDWDDYKDSDVKGKIVVVRVNDPGSMDPNLFEGSTMTYFGRWIYKIEEARAQGARAILLIHTDRSAGYGWAVVQNSWGGEELYLPKDIGGGLEFSGWIREDALRRLLSSRRIDLDRLYRASMKKSFRPVPLELRMKIECRSRLREVRANNVVGEIPGKSGKRIVLLAHIDHLGRNPALEGDQIFNGAVDNGSAVAALMLTTRILGQCRDRLRHTVTVLACQAEEEGLLGSMHYVMNTDRSNILAAVNFESSPVWEESRSLMGVGARFSTIEGMLKEIAAAEGVEYTEFSLNDRGFFYRSDQYSFARHNIPAVWISAGEETVNGTNTLRNFFTGNYHTPKDEYDPDWDLGALRQTIRYALMLVEKIDQAEDAPRWVRKLTFPT